MHKSPSSRMEVATGILFFLSLYLSLSLSISLYLSATRLTCERASTRTFSTSQLPKALQHWGVLTILASKCAGRHSRVHSWRSQLSKVLRSRWCLTLLASTCASRHNGVHFFNISISKSAPNMRCFSNFGLEICFAPQWRAIFDLSCQCLRTLRFSEPTFRPSGATKHWKNTVCRDCSTFFGPFDLLSADSLFSDSLSLSLFLSLSLSLSLSLLSLSLLTLSLLWLLSPLLLHLSMSRMDASQMVALRDLWIAPFRYPILSYTVCDAIYWDWDGSESQSFAIMPDWLSLGRRCDAPLIM